MHWSSSSSSGTLHISTLHLALIRSFWSVTGAEIQPGEDFSNRSDDLTVRTIETTGGAAADVSTGNPSPLARWHALNRLFCVGAISSIVWCSKLPLKEIVIFFASLLWALRRLQCLPTEPYYRLNELSGEAQDWNSEISRVCVWSTALAEPDLKIGALLEWQEFPFRQGAEPTDSFIAWGRAGIYCKLQF